jgi:hypothetical protein
LRPKPVFVTVKHSVCTSKKTLSITITRIGWLMLFKEIISAYFENHVNTFRGQNAEILIFKASDAEPVGLERS